MTIVDETVPSYFKENRFCIRLYSTSQQYRSENATHVIYLRPRSKKHISWKKCLGQELFQQQHRPSHTFSSHDLVFTSLSHFILFFPVRIFVIQCLQTKTYHFCNFNFIIEHILDLQKLANKILLHEFDRNTLRRIIWARNSTWKLMKQ